MLAIRFSRTGKKKQPYFRLIVQDKRRDPWAKAIEVLGTRDPRTKELVLNEERIKYWLSQGAQLSSSVWNLFVDHKLVEGKKRNVTTLSKTRREKIVKEEDESKNKEAEAKAKAEAKATEAAAAAAAAKTEAEAKAKAEAEAAKAEAEAPKEAPAEAAPAEDKPVETTTEEAK